MNDRDTHRPRSSQCTPKAERERRQGGEKPREEEAEPHLKVRRTMQALGRVTATCP